MAQQRRKWGVLVAALVVALLTAGVALAAVHGDGDSSALRSRGVHTTGLVTYAPLSKSPSQLVEFTDAAGVSELGETHSSGFYYEGDQADIIYDPENPETNVVMAADLNPAWQDHIAYGVMAVLLALVTAVLVVVGLSRKESPALAGERQPWEHRTAPLA